MIRVRQLDCERRRDARQFVRFPFKQYRKCPQWVPPLVRDAEDVLDVRVHPFYEHSVAAFFVAERNGETIGRVAVMDNRRFNEYRDSRTAFFGYFDIEENTGATRLLFDAACSWARSRGLDEMRGPSEPIGAVGGGHWAGTTSCGTNPGPSGPM